ncbi:hypothetical protein IPZ58_29065 [Streptomyces roseoverticillatus]|uniref:hypothetical protein n=1 Tax=Streptomyces roseoverticillatus TaxID=66429 RepID=UPI001F1F9E01|nr:hypothetical protein [Streptomyces roseoverticillatus]MCF3105614.1 hypothetical protein [Streptomyces roseoverticillatus]
MARLMASELRRDDLVNIRGVTRAIKDIRRQEASRGTELVLVFKKGAPVRIRPSDTIETSRYQRPSARW